jgi:hypothetical protein
VRLSSETVRYEGIVLLLCFSSFSLFFSSFLFVLFLVGPERGKYPTVFGIPGH